MKVRLISQGAITKDDRFPDNDPDDKRFKRRLLAEGDSWFSLGSVPYENLLKELEFPERTIVVSIAEPGDEIVRMASPKHVKHFKALVTRKQTAYRWDAILLSGGGNDLIDRADDIVRSGSTVDACINQTQLRLCMTEVAAGYRALAEVRDSANSANPGARMVAHTYDRVTPRNAPALFFGLSVRGPYLYKAFVDKGVPDHLWTDLADRLMNTLADTILGLATGPKAIQGFEVVDTRGTLVAADLGTTKESGDWLNEIHPTKNGYRKLAAKVAQAIAP